MLEILPLLPEQKDNTMDPMSACCLQLSIIEVLWRLPDEKSSLYV